MSQVCEVNECILQFTPLPFHHLFYAWKGNLWISIWYRHLQICIFRLGWGIFSIPPTKHVTPKNEKLDLDILQHLEQLLGLALRWVISAYHPTMNITPKNEKLDLDILQHLEPMNVAPKNEKSDSGIL